MNISARYFFFQHATAHLFSNACATRNSSGSFVFIFQLCPLFWKLYLMTRLEDTAVLVSSFFALSIYYDYQLSKARRKFCYQVLTFNLFPCHRQLAPFPLAICRPSTSLTAKRAKFQALVQYFYQMETRKVASGNSAIWNPKLCRALLNW